MLTLPLEDNTPEPIEHVLALDPHIRLWALRVAQREALARADGPLGPLNAEIRFNVARGSGTATLALMIDVTARVLRSAVKPSRA
jgi:hypothetical protein